MEIEVIKSPYRAFLGHEFCQKGHIFGPAVRELFLLHFVLKGKGVLQTSDGLYALEEGEGFLISPGEVCTYMADSESPWEYLWAGVGATKETEEVLRRHDLEPGAHCFVFRDRNNIIPLLVELAKQRNRTSYEFTDYDQAMGAFYLLMGTIETDAEKHSEGRYLQKCYDYMENRYADQLTVEAMASSLHVSRSYLYRIFKQNLGISPQRAIINFRLEKASQLLERGEISLTEVALSCGFCDLSHFSKAYKARFNECPRIKKHTRK